MARSHIPSDRPYQISNFVCVSSCECKQRRVWVILQFTGKTSSYKNDDVQWAFSHIATKSGHCLVKKDCWNTAAWLYEMYSFFNTFTLGSIFVTRMKLGSTILQTDSSNANICATWTCLTTCAVSEGSGQTAQMRSLTSAFAVRIRLVRIPWFHQGKIEDSC